MKPGSVALFAVALLVAMAWPLTAAIGAARAGAAVSGLVPASCTPDETAAGPADDDGEALVLPPGHPSIAGQLPPGHPPISADGLPPGHPPVPRALPPGHPRIPSGHAPGAPIPADLFGEPILLSI